MKARRVLGLPVLILTTTGRRTRRHRSTPLAYFTYGKSHVVTASNGGKASNPDWFFNLSRHPAVEVQLPDAQWKGTAEVASPALRGRLWRKLILLAPTYGAFQKRTKRLIPMVLLHPHQPGKSETRRKKTKAA